MRVFRTSVVAALAGSMLTPAAAFATSGPNDPILGSAALSLNGTAAVTTHNDRSVLELTGGGFKQAGSAWATQQVDVRSGFDVEFTAHLFPGPGGADGIALVVQADGPRALGGWGGGLGYRGIRNSVAVEFDTYHNGPDPSGNHVAVTVNGQPDTHVASADAPVPLQGRPFQARVRYDGQNLEVHLDAVLVLRQQVDLAGTVGAGSAWVGFTGATGLITSEQHVYDWSVTAPD